MNAFISTLFILLISHIAARLANSGDDGVTHSMFTIFIFFAFCELDKIKKLCQKK